MDLRRVVRVLNQCCAPHLADTWDNVGLLVQSSEAILVSRVLVTNDLTEPVLSEARERETNLIVSYHPPIFSPLKRITNSHWKERLIAACLENRIAIYSPHTGLDAKMNGVNDWLMSPFDLISKKPITPVPHREESMTKLTLPISESFSQFYMNLSGTPVSARLSCIDGPTINLTCSTTHLPSVMKQARDLGILPIGAEEIRKMDSENEGYGRIGCLREPMKLPEVLQAYKTLFGLNHLTLALGYGRKLDEPIRTVAVCAGSGSSVLNSNTVAQLADLFVTGEMSHHDRLDAVSRGISLIIAGHSNTERGFLATRLVPELQNLLTDELSSGDPGTSSVQVFMSKVDTEPGTIV